MLLIDLFAHRKGQEMNLKKALLWSSVWISLGLSFALVIYFFHGGETPALEYLTAFTIEKMLSVDNIFVFALIFSQNKVPKAYHHKALFWGVIGAVLFRAIFIFLGVWLIKKTYFPTFNILGQDYEVNAVLLIFGFILLKSGFGTLLHKKDDKDYTRETWTLKALNKIIPITKKFVSDKIFVRENGLLKGTLLFWVILSIEFSDIVFAIDSIPSILSVTKDFTVIYTSNIFAVMGLRTIYFLLVALMGMFKYLNYALGIILTFIGGKMVLEPIIHVSPEASLLIILSVMIGAILISYLHKKNTSKSTTDIKPPI